MDETKKKFALWAYPTTLEKVERLYQLDNCRSKSEFIEKAVLFYAGYVCAEDCREYFPEAIVSTIQGSLDSFENRMASLLFKYAVELAMTMHVSAANFRVMKIHLPGSEESVSMKSRDSTAKFHSMTLSAIRKADNDGEIYFEVEIYKIRFSKTRYESCKIYCYSRRCGKMR